MPKSFLLSLVICFSLFPLSLQLYSEVPSLKLLLKHVTYLQTAILIIFLTLQL